ncbi:TNT domain-containing protein [Rhodococcus sp. NPDC003318]|uniref:TNT domain-containing protein n=1 Tax=Rhodococcus sp. NPDC003318 TaxID=3364503 RepID=UPI00368E36D6
MRRRQLLLVFAFVLSTVFAEGAVAQAAPGSSVGSSDLLGGAGCSAEYFDGDKRLGPQTLSDQFPVADQLADYRRTGDLTPEQFLAEYWDPTVLPAGSYKYPPKNGYVLDGSGNPRRVEGRLDVGTLIDRYGSEGGNFLAPAGASYTSRALPPVNLVGVPAETCNYHVYLVTKALPLYTGPIAPWFEQEGYGTQYEVVADLLPQVAECGSKVDVTWLRCAGYVRLVYPPQ